MRHRWSRPSIIVAIKTIWTIPIFRYALRRWSSFFWLWICSRTLSRCCSDTTAAGFNVLSRVATFIFWTVIQIHMETIIDRTPNKYSWSTNVCPWLRNEATNCLHIIIITIRKSIGFYLTPTTFLTLAQPVKDHGACLIPPVNEMALMPGWRPLHYQLYDHIHVQYSKHLWEDQLR